MKYSGTNYSHERVLMTTVRSLQNTNHSRLGQARCSIKTKNQNEEGLLCTIPRFVMVMAGKKKDKRLECQEVLDE